MPVISRWLAAADLTRASASSHFHVPFFGSTPRHSGKRRTEVTPAGAILGNHSAWLREALADELTPQGVAAGCCCGGSDRAGAGRTATAGASRARHTLTP